jgi:hypothetical protein
MAISANYEPVRVSESLIIGTEKWAAKRKDISSSASLNLRLENICHFIRNHRVLVDCDGC